MPQMSPLYWLFLMMFFLLIFLFFICINYYSYYYTTNLNQVNKNNHFKIKNLIWKW